jgi:hypothetical protein
MSVYGRLRVTLPRRACLVAVGSKAEVARPTQILDDLILLCCR